MPSSPETGLWAALGAVVSAALMWATKVIPRMRFTLDPEQNQSQSQSQPIPVMPPDRYEQILSDIRQEIRAIHKRQDELAERTARMQGLLDAMIRERRS